MKTRLLLLAIIGLLGITILLTFIGLLQTNIFDERKEIATITDSLNSVSGVDSVGVEYGACV
jgi:hypothetical protein